MPIQCGTYLLISHMTLQRHQPSIPLLTQDSFTAVTLPDHVDIVIRHDRWRLDANGGRGPEPGGKAARKRGRVLSGHANADENGGGPAPHRPAQPLTGGETGARRGRA